MNTELKFFKTVLGLFEDKMNYDQYVLAKHDIFPSKTYPYSVSDNFLAMAFMISIQHNKFY